MADPQRGDDEFPEDDEGGESTVSMSSPTLEHGGMPSPVSVPPPPMGAPPQPPAPPQLSVPTSPAPFTPQAPPGFPMAGRANPPKPLPAAGAPPPREMVTSGQATGAAGMPAGMKRPQTVIGLAPPPVGSPRPGQPVGARPPLPSGKGPTPAAAPRAPMGAAAAAPASERNPPSSGRGVRPPSSPRAAGSSPEKDADATDEQLAQAGNPRDSIPDSQKEDFATMAKSPEESLALFGLDPGVANAARAAVKPGAAPQPPSNRSPLASTNLAQPNKPIPAPPSRPGAGPPPLPPESSAPVLHDRHEEEESTRAVSREEMLRGHDAVIIGEDSEGAQGEDATLALSPGLNEAAHLTALADALTKEQQSKGQIPAATPAGPQAAPPPPPGFDPNFGQPPPPAPPTNHGWQQPHPMAPPQAWPQDPNAYPGGPGPQSYPGMSVGPVSGPHLPAQSWTPNAPPSQPHFPGAAPQSQPQLPVPQSGQMMAAQQPGPIPYPGQPNIHQPPPNPFGDWNANAAPVKKTSKISGQIILLGIVGVVCLAIFITGIVLFATTKF